MFKTWLLCVVAMQAWSPDAAADWRAFAKDTLERISAYLELGETAVTKKLATPEEFTAIMPALVRKRGVLGVWGREVKNLGDNADSVLPCLQTALQACEKALEITPGHPDLLESKEELSALVKRCAEQTHS